MSFRSRCRWGKLGLDKREIPVPQPGLTTHPAVVTGGLRVGRPGRPLARSTHSGSL
jgi:hypothetical protein